MTSTAKPREPEIPPTIVDLVNGNTYTRGQFLGKGGFAKCYEVTDKKTNKPYAVKVVSKQLLVKNNQREKMSSEIDIHRQLHHKHVVNFVHFFEDKNFVYIVLELCRRKSMMELHRRRKALTEPEVRYYMYQILHGVMYLHDQGIIHRDLKLGNLFLNDNVEVKIGDFGLATRIEFNGQRKKTLCGTPNYIAPEILTKKGHSFEVDVWSIGCIMYTLLIGKPPFETNSLSETYNRIKRCEYKIPSDSKQMFYAVDMIKSMLQSDPSKRPSVKVLLGHHFFSSGYNPSSLPVSCLSMAPRFDIISRDKKTDSPSIRRPLGEINNDQSPVPKDKPRSQVPTSKSPDSTTSNLGPSAVGHVTRMGTNVNQERINHMKTISLLLKNLMNTRFPILQENQELLEEMSDPAAQPFFWISKWVDYSDKYGFGYQLNDDSVGVMFNDKTKIVLLRDQKNVHYFERDGIESYYTIDTIPNPLEKKKKLLNYFTRYMSEHLMKTGAAIPIRECESLSRIPYINFWTRSSNAVVMQLTDGTIQINFLDHTKIILCPLMEAVTYIDPQKSFRTYRIDTIAKKGCTKGLENCLRYANSKIAGLLTQ